MTILWFFQILPPKWHEPPFSANQTAVRCKWTELKTDVLHPPVYPSHIPITPQAAPADFHIANFQEEDRFHTIHPRLSPGKQKKYDTQMPFFPYKHKYMDAPASLSAVHTDLKKQTSHHPAYYAHIPRYENLQNCCHSHNPEKSNHTGFLLPQTYESDNSYYPPPGQPGTKQAYPVFQSRRSRGNSVFQSLPGLPAQDDRSAVPHPVPVRLHFYFLHSPVSLSCKFPAASIVPLFSAFPLPQASVVFLPGIDVNNAYRISESPLTQASEQ